MRRKELIDHFRDMTPGELIENYFEAKLNTPKKQRSIEINEGIEACSRNLEISLSHVLIMDCNRNKLEIQGGFIF